MTYGARQTIRLLADHAPLHVELRSPVADDTGYMRETWAEGYKQSPEAHRLNWSLYKRLVRPQLYARLAAPDTLVIVAHHGDGIAGWVAYSPGRRTSALHWVHTRYELDDEPLRLRGVMTQLIDAAQLGQRVVMTHRGPFARHRGCGETSDKMISKWMLGRGQVASYIPYEEWKR